jgi:hypothetical protein
MNSLPCIAFRRAGRYSKQVLKVTLEHIFYRLSDIDIEGDNCRLTWKDSYSWIWATDVRNGLESPFQHSLDFSCTLSSDVRSSTILSSRCLQPFYVYGVSLSSIYLIKVKLFLCLMKHHAFKVYGKWTCSSNFLDLGSKWKWVISWHPGRFTPLKETPCTDWIGGWVDHRANLDAVVKHLAPSWNQTPIPLPSSP